MVWINYRPQTKLWEGYVFTQPPSVQQGYTPLCSMGPPGAEDTPVAGACLPGGGGGGDGYTPPPR